MAGRILREDVERVRLANDLVTVASERVALKRSGRRFVARCPFHDEKTPSFSINPELGRYYCFGCQASGDVIQFVADLDGLDFVSAVEVLAQRGGVELHYENESAADRSRRRMKPRLTECLAAAVQYHHELLLRSPDATAARSYLTSRGFGKDVAAKFRIGWASPEWDACCRHLRRLGFRDEEVRGCGVGLESSRGNLIDQLRGRVIFPIFDPQGQPVALAGRVLEAGTDQPKYKNSPETDLYKKSRTLYGLNWARADVVSMGEVVVVEGYTDVIGFHQAGAVGTVATCGTALGEDHLRLIKQYTPRVVLAFDADAAGEMATERVFDMTARLGLDVWVATMPPGRDPADVAAEGPEAVAAVLERRRPLLEFKLDRELARAELGSAAGEARALDAAARVIAMHPDTGVRYAAARGLTRRLRDVDEALVGRRVEEFRREIEAQARETSGHRAGPANEQQRVRMTRIEGQALAMLMQQPEEFLAEAPDVAASWFSSEAAVEVATALLDAVAARPETGRAPIRVESLPDDLAPILARLAVVDLEGIDDPATAAREAARSLRRNWVDRTIADLQRAMDRAEADGDLETVRRLDSELVPFIERRQALGGP
ncbi:MAG: DNA primase [Acidimicrobiia bacterium]|nr:DNA primase [Acidimicrobiia bacterium]